ncbi:MAG: hypothetical protein NT154_03450 [Verrucomicrobia bacterium]|nr:hypothetical protein [Verrucomicrobiota bacterium]
MNRDDNQVGNGGFLCRYGSQLGGPQLSQQPEFLGDLTFLAQANGERMTKVLCPVTCGKIFMHR